MVKVALEFTDSHQNVVLVQFASILLLLIMRPTMNIRRQTSPFDLWIAALHAASRNPFTRSVPPIQFYSSTEKLVGIQIYSPRYSVE